MQPSMQQARRNLAVLVAAQAILGAQMSMIFIIGGLVGQTLAPNPCLATVPLSMIVLGSALTARPLWGFMQRHGRRAGFQLAILAGAVGAGISFAGIGLGSFTLFMAGSFLTGIYMSAQGFYRFAATDTAPPEFEAKAISWVMAGGLLSAIIGPALVRATSGATAVPFMASYLAIVGLNLIGLWLFMALDIPKPQAATGTTADHGRPTAQILRDPTIAVAMICAMVAYALMNLVMTSTPLAMVGCGFDTRDAANVVSFHIVAMFAPAFFTGSLISRFGAHRIVAVGLVILACAGAVALSGVALDRFYIALILLGLGWNFGFIGATAMLTAAHRPEERGRIQGVNDAVVFGGVFLASLSSGGLMGCAGGTAEQGWAAVNMAMLPFLVLAGGALIWLALRPRETR